MQKHLMQGCQILSKPNRDAFLIRHCGRAAKAVLTGMDAAASHCLKGSSQLKHQIFQDLSSDLSSQKSGRCHSWCDGLGLWSDCCRHVWTKKNGSVFDRFQTFVFLVNVLGEVPVSWTPSQWAPRGRTVLAYLKIWMTWMLKWAEMLMLKMLKISDRSQRGVVGYFIHLIDEAEHSKIAHEGPIPPITSAMRDACSSMDALSSWSYGSLFGVQDAETHECGEGVDMVNMVDKQ